MTGHKERLLKYLKENGDTMEAIQKLKNTRSSEYIRQLWNRKLFWNNLKKVLTKLC